MIDSINRAARRIPAWSVYVLGAIGILVIMAGVVFISVPDPVKSLERAFGERGLQVLIATLMITPLRWAGINLIKFRRAMGLVAFAFIALHFAVWISLDMGLRWTEILRDLYRRPYILIGFGAFLGLLPLAITSNNRSIKRLGPLLWRRLHWLTYPAILAGAVHFVLIGKVYKADSLIYLGVVVALLMARLVKSRKRAMQTA